MTTLNLFGSTPQRPRQGIGAYNPIGTSGDTLKPLTQPTTQQQPQAPQARPQPPQAPQTFAQMQAQGIARPAPPSMLNQQIGQAVSQRLANPSQAGSQATLHNYSQLARGIDDDFRQRDVQVREELAARGLGAANDSSVGLGRLSDLNIGRRSAQTELADRLLGQQLDREGQDWQSAMAAAQQFSGEQQRFGLDYARLGQDKELAMGAQGLQRYGLDLNAGLDRDRLGLDSRRLDQDASQYAQDFGLRSELGRGEQALSRDRFGFDQTNAAANRQQQTDMQGRDHTVQREQQRAQTLASLFQALGMNPDIDVNMLLSLFGGGQAGGQPGGQTPPIGVPEQPNDPQVPFDPNRRQPGTGTVWQRAQDQRQAQYQVPAGLTPGDPSIFYNPFGG